MTKTLVGIVISGDNISASYDENGPGSLAGPWSDTVHEAVTAMQSTIDTAISGTATTIQLYTASSNPDGATRAQAGNIVDAWTGAGGNPDVRFGEAATVPTKIASARNALKAAMQDALNG